MASTLSASTGFNEENFLKKLDNVTPTQDSIQSLALWIIHHKINHEAICRLWLKKLNDASSGKQRLALFYLANDVIQNCKRKNAKIFQDTFKSWLIEAVELVKNDAIKKKIERVFDVWSERNVYDHEFIVKLNETLYKEDTIIKQSMSTKSPILTDKPGISVTASKSPPSSILSNHQQSSDHESKNETEYQKIITEFQPKKLRESINSFYSLQNEVNLSKTNVEATRLLDINVEHIKQYRDKNQCAKFKVEFENSCNKLEEFIHKLTEETEQRKLLIQLLKQGEIFYDAQFKDATTVYNAYKSYGYKVSTVKRKLDELIAHKFNPNDVKLDNLDMEMSDEDETDDLKSKANHHHYSKQSFSKTRSPPHLSTSSLASSSNASIRNNLDPRQNRHSSHHSSASNNSIKKTSISSSTSSSSSSSSKINLNNSNPKRKTANDYEDDLNLQHASRDRSNTPVKDEHSPNKPSSSNNNNPLDFLTKFINKSAGNDLPAANSPTTAVSTNSATAGSSANLSYLVDSLKKFVNTSTTTPGAAASYVENTNSTSFMSQQGVTQFYDHPLNNQNSFIQSRSATPTKDEIYQPRIDQTKTIQSMPPLPPLPPPLPPLPMDSMQQPPPGPHSPYIPPFHPMMYQQNPSNQIYNNFAFAPPPPPPPNLPPPNMLMMIDPNNCYQYPHTVATNNNKMMISPPLSSTSTGSSSSANQANSPTNQSQSYWANGFNPSHVEETSANNGSYSDDNQMRIAKFNGNNNNNDYSSPYKRKFNNNGNKYYNEDNNRGHYNNKNNKNFNNNNNNNNNNNKVQQNQFNRIPTISSNRSTVESNNNNNSNNQNKWGANSGPKANRF